jgi:hypothetical protein
MKHTPWFSANVKPVRAGVYEIKNISFRKKKLYRYWNGKRWCSGATTPNSAILKFKVFGTGAPVVLPWRGLAEEPK